MIKIAYDPFEYDRRSMVDEQLIPRGIKDKKVLDAFYNVPRELFVPDELTGEAYQDHPLPTIHRQTISQPYIMALMTELLEAPENERAKILEIGTGSGYQAALLAYMGHDVVSVERLDELVKFAERNLEKLTYTDKIKIRVGDGCLGWPEEAPYDGILVTAASPQIPPKLVEQLKIGGKLVIPVGNILIQELLQVIKTSEHDIEINKSIGCRFVPLIGVDAFNE